MSCTQKQQLVCFPKVRVYKPWFRHFNDHKDFRNEGTVHLFSLMALFSYANYRSNERVIYGDRYMEAPGQWICKLGALPRILRVHSKAQALELMEYFRNHGFLTFEILDEEKEILRFTIADWKEHCTHLSIIVADKLLLADINEEQMHSIANELNLVSVTGWHSVFLADDSMIYMYRQCLWLSMSLTYEDLLTMLKECISEYKRGKGRLTTGEYPTDPVA